jgi:hypothetical protein
MYSMSERNERVEELLAKVGLHPGTQRFPRVKGCEGILEDHLDVFADAFSQLFFR